MTPSVRIALDDLHLERIIVLYPGTRRFPLSDQVDAIPLQSIAAGDTLFAQ